jgi:WD40 repeat protein
VFVWDIASGRQDGAAIRAHGTNDVWELVMHPDGDRFVTLGTDGMTKVWSLRTRRQVASPFATERVKGLLWSHDGSRLIAGGDGRVHEWDLARSRQVDVTEAGHEDRIEDAARSSNGSLLVTLGRDQDVRIWDLSARHPLTTAVATLDAPQWGLAASPDGKRVAVGGGDSTVTVYDLATTNRVARLTGASGKVFALAFVDAHRLVAGDERGTLLLWDLSSRREPWARRSAHADPIMSVAASRDGRTVASADSRGVVRVWRGEDMSSVAATKAHPGGVTDLTFTPSGEIVAAGNDGTVAFWTTEATQARDALVVDHEGDTVRSTAVSPDGKTLAVANANRVTLWDLATGAQWAPLTGQPAAPLDVQFSPDGEWIASTSRDGTIALWETRAGERLGARFSYHDDAVWHAAITTDSVLVTASLDGSVQSLDVLDWRLACKLGAGAFDRRNRQSYLGGAQPVGCRG